MVGQCYSASFLTGLVKLFGNKQDHFIMIGYILINNVKRFHTQALSGTLVRQKRQKMVAHSMFEVRKRLKR